METRRSKHSINWEPDERAGLGPTNDGTLIEKIIRAKLNPWNRKDGYFDLYYFVQRPKVTTRKTVLFCAGGPGEIVRNPIEEATFASFLVNNEFNVAFFHFRGAGFSQVPASNSYDKFLRTRYAAEDIETIRTDFLGENGKWEAVIAWSYGTVLAHQYAYYHSRRVGKLILLAPLSRHMFTNSLNAFDEFNEDVRRIQKRSLERILEAKEFDFEEELALKPGDKEKIIRGVFGDQSDSTDEGIFGKTENAFGSIQFVVDEYSNLRRRGVLKDYAINMYGRDFFRKLRQLRFVGSSVLAKQTREAKLAIGKEIRDEILDEKRAVDDAPQLHTQGSDRVFYTVGALDGISPRFLREWLAGGKKNPRTALKKSGGDAHVKNTVNSRLEKVNISNKEKIKPWDPAKYRHNVATLILKGEADPVTAGGQAEHLFRKGLSGNRTLIEFPGIGHDFMLPEVEGQKDKSLPSGVIRFDPRGIPPGKTWAVTAKIQGLRLNKKLHMKLEPPEEFKPDVAVLGVAFVDEGHIIDPDKATNNVIVLIKNRRSKELKLDLHQTYWRLSCHFFEGTVEMNYWSPSDPLSLRLVSGPVTLPPQTVLAVYGRVCHGARNHTRLYRLQPEDGPGDGLETLGFNIGERNVVHLWLKATKQVQNASAKKWTLSRDTFKKTFRVKPRDLKENEVLEVTETIDGLNFDSDEEIDMIISGASEGRLDAFIPQEETSDRIPIIVTNTKEDEFSSRPTTWQVESPYFTAGISVDPPQIPSRGGVKINGRIVHFRWKKWLEIMMPKDLDPQLELLGFNILSEDKVSLVLKNRGLDPVKGGRREWIYMDPNERAGVNEAVSLRIRKPLLNRIIYSFLIMEPVFFTNEKHNESLKIARTAFVDDDSRAVKIEFTDGNGKRTGN